VLSGERAAIMKLRDAKLQHYDIVRIDRGKNAIWLESAADLSAAESRIEELTSFWPGEFQVIDQHSHQVVSKSTEPYHDVTEQH
jgi:hypothetical protein